jgi:hypothetical protein
VSGAIPSTVRDVDRRAAPGTALVAVGVAPAGSGACLHSGIAGRVSAGRCDGCDPWHPLSVVAPLVVGTALVLAGTRLYTRR